MVFSLLFHCSSPTLTYAGAHILLKGSGPPCVKITRTLPLGAGRPVAHTIPSDNGDAWSHFTHDHARLRAFRWGEDGIAGVCDSHGFQNIGFSFWNEKEYVTFRETTTLQLESETVPVIS